MTYRKYRVTRDYIATPRTRGIALTYCNTFNAGSITQSANSSFFSSMIHYFFHHGCTAGSTAVPVVARAPVGAGGAVKADALVVADEAAGADTCVGADGGGACVSSDCVPCLHLRTTAKPSARTNNKPNTPDRPAMM